MKHKSVSAKWILGVIWATAVLAACTAANDPTPEAPLAEVVTVSVERPSVTATAPPSSTPTATRSLVETAVPTSTPQPTSSPIPSFPSATPNPQLVWNSDVEIMTILENVNTIEWSPNQNEFIFQTCEGRFIEGYNFDGSFFKASAPLFEAIDLTQEDFQFCQGLANLTWTTDGTQIIFSGPLPEDTDTSWPSVEFGEVWQMDSDGSNPGPILPGETITRWLNFNAGWLDDNLLVYSGYAGGGHIFLGILNIETKEKLAWAIVHLGGGTLNSNFIATDNGATFTSQISAAIISTILQHPSIDDGFNSPYLHHLSFDDETRNFEFYSLFQDWRPNSNEMLVLTWDRSQDLFEVNMLEDAAVTSLQLWNVENDMLTMLFSEAIFGSFSPDGRFLLYLTPASDFPIAHIYDWQNQQIVEEQSVVATHEPEGLISFESSFSPDGRFLTYFTPNEDGTTTLQIIDPMRGETLWQLVNPVTRVAWSPTSEQFIYRDSDGNLALFTVAAGSSQRLTLEGGRLLTNPQWSYDSRYLSVSVQNETGGETAVLTFANNP